ncbi:hypothetical protein RSAG8_06712, partial [Rhizoctonia solani AG-8 WAC10335]
MPRQERDQDETGTQNALSEREVKKQMKQMRKDIKLLQKKVMEAEEGQARAEKEKEALQAQIDEGNGPNIRLGTDNVESGASKLSESKLEEWKSIARTAGGRAMVLYDPFLDIEPLAGHQVQSKIDKILDDVMQAQEGDEELDEECNPAIYWKTERFTCPSWVDMTREMIFHLPRSPGKMWLERWFQHEIGKGARKLRSTIAHYTALHYEKIFGFVNRNFKDREKRPNLPEVQALQNFLHINERDDEGNLIMENVFRDPIIVRVLRLLLFGQSAVETGYRSPKARKAHAKQWHTTHITPSLLAFAATIILFVLSGDGLLEVGSGSTDYPAWYRGRLQLLKGVYERYPDIYNNIILYYNREVFGMNPPIEQDDDQDNQGPEDETVGMDQDDLEFLETIGA